jgi:crotonobetainyl-CoA:carnitine CoA-transferase CaiB-like acyl-CoA transferase
VESPDGDMLSRMAPAWYASLHRGCTIETLDLKSAEGRRALAVRLANADVLLTSSRTAALGRMGLDWTDVHARFPRLVHVAIVGELPPRDNRAGHDLTYVAALQLLEPPALPRTLLADLAGAERAVTAACALLLQRERAGTAGRAFVSLREAAETFAEPFAQGLTRPGGVLGGGFAGYRAYRSSDGWIVVAALEPAFWRRVLTLLGLPEPADAEELARAFARRSSAEWESWGDAHDVPVACVVPADPA